MMHLHFARLSSVFQQSVSVLTIHVTYITGDVNYNYTYYVVNYTYYVGKGSIVVVVMVMTMMTMMMLSVSEDDRKSERATSGIREWKGETPLVARPFFPSSPLTESLEQATFKSSSILTVLVTDIYRSCYFPGLLFVVRLSRFFLSYYYPYGNLLPFFKSG